MSDIKVDFNLIKIGILAVVLRWGFPRTFVAQDVHSQTHHFSLSGEQRKSFFVVEMTGIIVLVYKI